MASKHKKKYSASFVIRELQSKIMIYHYTLIRIAKIQNNDDTKCWQECESMRTLIALLVEVQNSTTTLEDSLVVSYKTKHTLTM